MSRRCVSYQGSRYLTQRERKEVLRLGLMGRRLLLYSSTGGGLVNVTLSRDPQPSGESVQIGSPAKPRPQLAILLRVTQEAKGMGAGGGWRVGQRAGRGLFLGFLLQVSWKLWRALSRGGPYPDLGVEASPTAGQRAGQAIWSGGSTGCRGRGTLVWTSWGQGRWWKVRAWHVA